MGVDINSKTYMEKLQDDINKSFPTMAKKKSNDYRFTGLIKPKRKWTGIRNETRAFIYVHFVLRFFSDYIQEDINEYIANNEHEVCHDNCIGDLD